MSLSHLTPADLDAFVSVAETGSFRRSAERLGVTQPTVSARIQHLEGVLGVALFHRTTRRVAITQAGEQLRRRVMTMVLETRALLQEFKDDAHLKRGRVVLGATPSVAAGFLPGVVDAFQRRHPTIEVVLQDDFFGQALDRVGRGDVDLAVIPIAIESETMVCEPLFRDEFRLAVAEAHRFAARTCVALEDLASERLISMPRESAAWATLAHAFAARNLAFAPVFHTRDSMTMLSLIRQGLGIGFIPEMLSSIVNMQGLAFTPAEGVDLGRTIGIVRARDRKLSNAAEAFCRQLRTSSRSKHHGLGGVDEVVVSRRAL